MKPQDDTLLQLYEEANALADEKPAPAVHAAVMAHARLAAQKPAPRTASNWPQWKSGLVASVLLVPLAGMLWLQLRDTPEADVQVASAPRAESPPVAAAPVQSPKPAAESTAATAPAKAEARAPAAKLTKPTVAAPPAPPAPQLMAKTESASVSPGFVGQVAPAPAAEASPSRADNMVAAAKAVSPPSMVMSLAPPPSAPAAGAAMRSRTSESLADRDVKLQTKRDAQGRTPLILAVRANDEALVKRLLELGADTKAQDNDGLTALQHAQRLDLPRIAALLEPKN